MNSKLVLYNVPFTDDENKLIENIEFYLKNTESSDALEDTYPEKRTEIGNFQFIRHKLDLEIKIVGSQFFAPALDSNYCSITNEEYDESGETPVLSAYSGTYYYFITDVVQLAENTLKLVLKMDVLNTFGDAITDDENWLPETFVEREHRDRFFDDEDYLNETYWTRGDKPVPYAHIKVDPVPEDIDLPLYKTDEKKIKDIFNNKPFYLVYKSSTMYTDGSKPVEQIERDNAIRCFLVAGSDTEIPMLNYYGNAVDLSMAEIGGTDFANLANTGTEWVFLDSDDNPDMLISVRYKSGDNWKYQGFYAREIRNAGYHIVFGICKVSSHYRCFAKLFTLATATTETMSLSAGYNIVYQKTDKIVEIPYTYYISGSNVRKDIGLVGTTSQDNVIVQGIRKGWKANILIANDDNLPGELQTYANWKTYKAGLTGVVFTENSEIVNMKTIDEVDRTDSRIVKIIELPYAPNEPHQNGSGGNTYYDFGANWTSSADIGEDLDMTNCFQLSGTSLEKNFKRVFNEEDSQLVFGVECLRDLFDYTGENFITPRVSEMETKLQHSDFYKPVIYYDSFSVEFKCERRYNTYHQEWVDGTPLTNYLKEGFNLYYAVANNIVNGLVFVISDDYDVGYEIVKIEHYDTEDYYPLTMVCIRNNEVNIYNNAYLQYIRGGYNYDVKSKGIAVELAQHNAITSFGDAILGSLQNPVGIVRALWDYDRQKQAIALQSKQYQVSIDKSLKEASLRATSVSGSDNLDLLKHYAGNCLYSAVFKLNELWTNKIATLLHYFGYATNMNKVPNLTGRLFFNYVKGTPVFKKPISIIARKNTGLPISVRYGFNMEIQNEVIKKFSSGVAIIHRYELDDGIHRYAWNVSMDKENWEEFLEPLKDM